MMIVFIWVIWWSDVQSERLTQISNNASKSATTRMGSGPESSQTISAMVIGRKCASARRQAGFGAGGWSWGSDSGSRSGLGEVGLFWSNAGPSRKKSASWHYLAQLWFWTQGKARRNESGWYNGIYFDEDALNNSHLFEVFDTYLIIIWIN